MKKVGKHMTVWFQQDGATTLTARIGLPVCRNGYKLIIYLGPSFKWIPYDIEEIQLFLKSR